MTPRIPPLAPADRRPDVEELPLLVGSYTAVAFFLRSCGVEPEEGLPVMPGR